MRALNPDHICDLCDEFDVDQAAPGYTQVDMGLCKVAEPSQIGCTCCIGLPHLHVVPARRAASAAPPAVRRGPASRKGCDRIYGRKGHEAIMNTEYDDLDELPTRPRQLIAAADDKLLG